MEEYSSRFSTLDLRGFFSVIWDRKWVVLAILFIFTAAALLWTFFIAVPLYQSSTEILQRRTGIDRALLGSDVFQQSSSQPERELRTAAELVLSPEVETAVINELGESLKGKNPSDMVTVEAIKKADILRITATDTDPELAADVANSYAAQYIKWRLKIDRDMLEQARLPIEAQIESIPEDQMESTRYQVLTEKLETLKLIEAMQTGNLEIVKPATASQTPISPKPVKTISMAFALSLVFATALILLLEKLNTRVRSIEEISAAIDKPILAIVPRQVQSEHGSPITLKKPASACSEAYRLLKTNIEYVEPDKEIHTIMLTSPGPCEGKSTTIVNLAITLARSNKRVIVFEGDLRKPTVDQYFGLQNSLGITSILSGECTLREALQMIEASDIQISNSSRNKVSMPRNIPSGPSNTKPIYFATSGPIPPNPGELIASDKMGTIISEARDNSDFLLIDTPPLGIVGDAASLAAKVDGVIIVLRMSQTSKKSLGHVQDFIEKIPSTVLGIVVTDANLARSYGYKKSYYNYGD